MGNTRACGELGFIGSQARYESSRPPKLTGVDVQLLQREPALDYVASRGMSNPDGDTIFACKMVHKSRLVCYTCTYSNKCTGSAMTSEKVTDHHPGKFSDLMLYISHRCRDAERFGVVKLAKMLYYCDFEAVRRLGIPITGATYIKEAQGPLPRRFYSTLRSLVREQRAEVRLNRITHYDEERLVPIDDSIVLSDLFSDQERVLIDETIERLIGMSGTELTDFSHKEFGWEYGRDADPIPYSTALLPRTDNPVFADWLESR